MMNGATYVLSWFAGYKSQQYDEKADVFSFAIVLWELVTAKVIIKYTILLIIIH